MNVVTRSHTFYPITVMLNVVEHLESKFISVITCITEAMNSLQFKHFLFISPKSNNEGITTENRTIYSGEFPVLENVKLRLCF